MLSELQQKEVWEGWLGAEIRANYFADMCGHYDFQQKLVTWLILFVSCGAAVTFLADWPHADVQWIKPALSLLAAGLSLFSLVQQNQKRTTDCADLHSRWSKLGNEYKALWDDMYSQNAPETLRRLEEKEVELSKNSTSIPNKGRRMSKWQDYVLRQHKLAPAA
jgi:hypothetical protein